MIIVLLIIGIVICTGWYISSFGEELDFDYSNQLKDGLVKELLTYNDSTVKSNKILIKNGLIEISKNDNFWFPYKVYRNRDESLRFSWDDKHYGMVGYVSVFSKDCSIIKNKFPKNNKLAKEQKQRQKLDL